MGSITTSQALGAKQTNLLLRGLRLARTHSSISCFAKKSGSSCWTHMVATDPFQYVPSTSCRCSAEGVGATLFIFKQPWHRPFSEAKKSVPTPQMSREPLSSTTVLDRNCAAPRSSTSRCRLPPRARLRCSRVGFAAAGPARARRTRVWGISARLAASRRPRRRQARARFASFSHRCRISSAAAVAGRAPRGARLHSLPHLS